MQTPARISAFSCAIVPASVAGAESAHLRHRADGHGQVEPRGLEEQVDAVEREAQRADRLQERVAERFFGGVFFIASQRDQDIVEVYWRARSWNQNVIGFVVFLIMRRRDFDAAIADR